MKANEACKLVTTSKLDRILAQIESRAKSGFKDLELSSTMNQVLYSRYSSGPSHRLDERRIQDISDPSVVKALKKLGYKVSIKKTITDFNVTYYETIEETIKKWYGAISVESERKPRIEVVQVELVTYTIAWCCE